MDNPDQLHRRFNTRYADARFVVAVLDVFGWLLALTGLIWFGWSVYSVAKLVIASLDGHQGSPFSILSLMGLLPSSGMVVGGVLVFAHGQLVRSGLDTADLTREIFSLVERNSPKEQRLT